MWAGQTSSFLTTVEMTRGGFELEPAMLSVMASGQLEH